MKTTHIVMKNVVDDDYNDIQHPLFAINNHITATEYCLKGDRVFEKLTKFYLFKYYEMTYHMDWEEEDEEMYKMYRIYSRKYEQFKNTTFEVLTVPYITV